MLISLNHQQKKKNLKFPVCQYLSDIQHRSRRHVITFQIFNTDQAAMLESLEQGDVAETIRIFFEQSHKVKPAKKGNLSLKQVDDFLEELSKMTREDDQAYHFEQICSQ